MSHLWSVFSILYLLVVLTTDGAFASDSCPCRNGGTCHFYSWSNKSFQCVCVKGFMGENCELENPCASNPCLRGGVCYARFPYEDGKYVCECTKLYRGTNCQLRNDCQPNKCQNGGRCLETRDGARCFCSSPYTGNVCQRKRCYPTLCVENLTGLSMDCTGKNMKSLRRLQACYQQNYEEIKKTKNCECDTFDLIETFYLSNVSYPGQYELPCVQFYSKTSMAGCTEVAITCAKMFERLMSTYKTFTKDNQRELTRCLIGLDSGQESLVDCQVLRTVYLAFRDYAKVTVPVMNKGGCDFAEIKRKCSFFEGKTGTRYYEMLCRELNSGDDVKACWEQQIKERQACGPLKEKLFAAQQFIMKTNKERYERFCYEYKKFMKMWVEDWGCQTTGYYS